MKVVYRVVSDFQRFSAPGTKMKVLYERLVDLPKQPPWTGEPIETLADALAFQILIETPADKPLRWMQEERIGNHSQHTSLDLSVSWWSAWLDRHQEARLQTKAAALKYAMRREMTPDIQDIMRFLAIEKKLRRGIDSCGALDCKVRYLEMTGKPQKCGRCKRTFYARDLAVRFWRS